MKRHRFTLTKYEDDWWLRTNLNEDWTISIVLGNDGTGAVRVKAVEAYTHGDELTLLTQDEFEQKIDYVRQENGCSRGKARTHLHKARHYTYEMAHDLIGWSIQQVVDDALFTWEALNLAADLVL